MTSKEFINSKIKAIKKILYELKDIDTQEGTIEDFNKYYNKLELKHLSRVKQDLERLAEIDKPCKLNYEGDRYDPTTGELVYDTAICPCGREFEIDYDEHCDYCPSCGRKLDWSECENGTDGTKD